MHTVERIHSYAVAGLVGWEVRRPLGKRRRSQRQTCLKAAVELRMGSEAELGEQEYSVGLVTDQPWLWEQLFNFSGPLFPSLYTPDQNSSHFIKGLRIK